MVRNLKLNIKNSQLAEAFKLSNLKARSEVTKAKKPAPSAGEQSAKPAAPAGSSTKGEKGGKSSEAKAAQLESRSSASKPPLSISTPLPARQAAPRSPLRLAPPRESRPPEVGNRSSSEPKPALREPERPPVAPAEPPPSGSPRPPTAAGSSRRPLPKLPPGFKTREFAPTEEELRRVAEISEGLKLGPTGRHIDDLLKPQAQEVQHSPVGSKAPPAGQSDSNKGAWESSTPGKGKRPSRGKEGSKLQRKASSLKSIETYLKGGSEDRGWRKPRQKAAKSQISAQSAVPTALSVRLPISVKDLAAEMKLKASQLISQLFMHGLTLTLNDLIEDDATIAVLGDHFQCAITIDTSREERLAVTGKSIDEEIAQTSSDRLTSRAAVVTFMGHVDHGKTSLIDSIRSSDRAAHEAGAITQHIGAFSCQTPHGPITVVDTPGHAAFAEMRARGARVTDLVVLVVAGDEGIMEQTDEVIAQAREAEATLVVAINKSDKPGFDLERIYRQLGERNLLPEAWGGSTVTVACSARTKEGVPELLELISLQAELLELKADFAARARGCVIEVQMHKGLGPLATLLVQNGRLKRGDALVFEDEWGRVRNMRDEMGREIDEALPSMPVAVTGMSGLPSAGEQFICVASEREAREIIEGRRLMGAAKAMQKRRQVSDALFANAAAVKVLNLVIRADVNGSLDALQSALTGIKSDKVELNIIAAGVGEVTESDILLAAASKAHVLGFHTQIESHADTLIKQRNVDVKMFDVIYHLVDGVRDVMRGLLDKTVREVDAGAAQIRAVFKSSKLGSIAGCLVTDGTIHRNHQIRVSRAGEIVHRGSIASIKRGQDDVREITKGLECGILLTHFSDLNVGDELQAIEITHIAQEL